MGVRYAWLVIAFGAFFTVFFSPALFGGNLLTTAGDGTYIALPMYLAPHGLWEPNIMLGYPWASNFSGYWDPLFLLHLIPHSFNAYMVLAYVIAAVGSFGCVYAVSRSVVGGAVAGLSYALGGFMIGHLGHYDIVHPAAWTPYVFWALIALREHLSVRTFILGSLAVGLCAVAGQPQVLVYTLIFASAYALTVGIGSSSGRRFAGVAAMMIILGLGTAAITLGPGALLGLSSFRSSTSLDYFLAFSIPVWQLPVRLLLPYVFGLSVEPFYPFSATGVGNEAEFSGYVGITTLILAALAVLVRRSDANVRFFVIAAFAALVLSAGDGFHIAALTFHIPVFNLFRAQGRHMLEFTLFASILGGIGAAEIARGNVSRKLIGIAIFVIGAGIAFATVDALRSGLLSPQASDLARNPAFAVPGAVFIFGSFLLWFCRCNSSRPLVAVLLTACTIADLSTFAWFQYWREPANERMLQPPAVVGELRTELDKTHQRLFSVEGAAAGGIPPNLSLVWGVPEAGGYVSMLLTSPGIFLQLFPQGTMAPELLNSGTDRSLDLAAIRYVIIPRAQADTFAAARKWKLLQQSPVGTIFENPRAEPRAWIVHRVISMPPDQALQTIREGILDANATALVAGDELDTRPNATDTAVILGLDSDSMHVDVTCKTECFLETSDTYNGMWKATIDGDAVALRLADYALRGVRSAVGTSPCGVYI